MCLYILNNGCKDICACIKKCCDCSDLGACLLSLLIGIFGVPAAIFVSLFFGFGIFFIKICPAVVNDERILWKRYCAGLNKGQEAYRGEAPAFYACIGEAYCCMLPCVLFASVVSPVAVIVGLLCGMVSCIIRAACGGCAASTKQWWANTSGAMLILEPAPHALRCSTPSLHALCSRFICSQGARGGSLSAAGRRWSGTTCLCTYDVPMHLYM